MPGKKPRKPRRGSETGFIDPEDGLHKAMAALPWPVLKDMLFPLESKPSEAPPEEPREPMTYIDPEDDFHKALEKLSPKQMVQLVARISANVPALKAKTPSEETPPRRRAKTRPKG
jgi:hypothetical protein